MRYCLVKGLSDPDDRGLDADFNLTPTDEEGEKEKEGKGKGKEKEKAAGGEVGILWENETMTHHISYHTQLYIYLEYDGVSRSVSKRDSPSNDAPPLCL